MTEEIKSADQILEEIFSSFGSTTDAVPSLVNIKNDLITKEMKVTDEKDRLRDPKSKKKKKKQKKEEKKHKRKKSKREKSATKVDEEIGAKYKTSPKEKKKKVEKSCINEEKETKKIQKSCIEPNPCEVVSAAALAATDKADDPLKDNDIMKENIKIENEDESNVKETNGENTRSAKGPSSQSKTLRRSRSLSCRRSLSPPSLTRQIRSSSPSLTKKTRSRSRSLIKKDSRSRSRSLTKKKHSRSRSRSLSKKRPSQTKSLTKKKRSLSPSTTKKRSQSPSTTKNRSRSRSLAKKKRSRSRSLSKKNLSRSEPLTEKMPSRSESLTKKKRARSRSLTRKKRSRSGSLARKKRSRSGSLTKKKRSRSRSLAKKKRSRSRSLSKKGLSRSGSLTKKKRSRSRSLTRKKPSRSGSLARKKRSRSRSLTKKKRSRSRSLTKKKRSRSRSLTKKKRSRSRSLSKKKRSRSRSLTKKKRSRSRSLTKRKRSRSRSLIRSSFHSSQSRNFAKKRRSRSRSLTRRKRSGSRSMTNKKRSRSRSVNDKRSSKSPLKHRPLLKESFRSRSPHIDKAQLLEIARTNLKRMQESGVVPVVVAPVEDVRIRVSKSSGKTVEELTDYCKHLVTSQGESADESEQATTGEPDTAFTRHPFQIKARSDSIVMNIRNAIPLPVRKPEERVMGQSQLKQQFPVSSGQQHLELEWIPVTPVTATSNVTKAISNKTNNKNPLATEAEKLLGTGKSNLAAVAPTPRLTASIPLPSAPAIDIGVAVAQRLSSIRKLQDNQEDEQARLELKEAEMMTQTWACLHHTNPMTGEPLPELINWSGAPQAWARKDQFTNAVPIAGGMGMKLLQKMGWQPGEGLGRHSEGTLEPLTIDIKLDKKGLVSKEEDMPKSSSVKLVQSFQGKHPVSTLHELCTKKRWEPPIFEQVADIGPDHLKHFLFKVIVNKVEYRPCVASKTKKEAKAFSAALCLEALGVVAGPN